MMKCTAAVLSLAVAWPFSLSVAGAQSMMRSPSLNIGSRIPTIAPSTMPRINPKIAAGAGRIAGRGPNIASREPIAGRVGITSVGPRGAAIGTTASRTPPISTRPGRTPPPKIVGVLPTIPYVRYSPNTYPSCAYANRAASGECNEKPFVADLGGGPTPRSQNAGGGPRSNGPQAALNTRYVPRQIVAELDSALTPDQTDALARRLRLERLSSQDFPLIGANISLFRITDNRSVETVESQMRAEADVRAVQPNFRYVLQDQVTAPALGEGDPAQYALAKLRLPEAHKLSAGANVTVAVIDSGIDVAHPELADAIVGSFDALGSKEGAHVHGTGIAGAIVSHARLMGSAPRARILAIRAFGVSQGGAESSSFVILKGINHAAMNGAQVINMSFAGPQDPLIERGIAASASKGIVMVAASGNAGPKSPPLYPAASPSVIAVSATDAYDRLFSASNRGSHIAVAAPGVDIFLPAPDNKYQMTSGTSFSAAYISGLAALMIERNPQLRPNEIRSILMTTARDLGAPGRDDLFGAGAADAYSAVSAVQGAQQPVATAPAPVTPVLVTAPAPTTRAVEASSPSMASDVQK
jgi:subtilisin family serine protease